MSGQRVEVSNVELCALLERNGYPSAAERIASGEDRAAATAYIVGRPPTYDDGEGRWLQDYIDALAKGERV